ncbi:hypothetical protein T484DRAFT_1856915, partial [Baffinella frigidus]
GIDLSSANLAIFLELPPDCGWVLQAEDRLHRPGQRDPVSIFFLVAWAAALRVGAT